MIYLNAKVSLKGKLRGSGLFKIIKVRMANGGGGGRRKSIWKEILRIKQNKCFERGMSQSIYAAIKNT